MGRRILDARARAPPRAARTSLRLHPRGCFSATLPWAGRRRRARRRRRRGRRVDVRGLVGWALATPGAPPPPAGRRRRATPGVGARRAAPASTGRATARAAAARGAARAGGVRARDDGRVTRGRRGGARPRPPTCSPRSAAALRRRERAARLPPVGGFPLGLSTCGFGRLGRPSALPRAAAAASALGVFGPSCFRHAVPSRSAVDGVTFQRALGSWSRRRARRARRRARQRRARGLALRDRRAVQPDV